MRPQISVAARFWLGVALPTLVLLLFILFLVFVTGQGKGAAPAGVFVLSVFILPVTMLANSWVLFVNWHGRGLLFAAGLALPLFVGCVLTYMIHGSHN
jgi:ABC-type phosphate transport system permease subunit